MEKFICPFCSNGGNNQILEKKTFYEKVTVTKAMDVVVIKKRGGKFKDVKVGDVKVGDVVDKKCKKLVCPKCGLVFPISQFFKQNRDLRIQI